MKKSNKLSVFYILTSISLLLVLLFGGVYGVYISVGLNFVKSSVSNVAGVANRATNVAYGGSVNFESSMTGVIILSIVLIVLAVFDIVALIKQIIFFKQFKAIKESKIERVVEKKVKSKGSVIFLACIVDIVSLIVGVVGIFINARTFIGNNMSWVLYVVDGAVCVLAIMSFILLFMKLRKVKKMQHKESESGESEINVGDSCDKINSEDFIQKFDIDKIEYCLIKLKYLKSCKIISADEYEMLRSLLFNKKDKNTSDFEVKKNKA